MRLPILIATALAATLLAPLPALAVGEGQTCGGIAGIACDAGLWCDTRPGFCRGADIQGTCVRVRSWCIPVYAPHPVSANAWLANALDPVYAAGESTASRRPTPVGAARALVPEAMLANPAIYPPPAAFENLVAPTFSTTGAAKRLAIWQDLGL